VSDIFREVDEEVRREQLQKLWERYQNLVYVGIFLILAGVGGWRAYEWYEAKRASETGAAFEAAQTLDQEGKAAEAESAYAKVVADGTASYRDLARVRQAAELAQRDSKLGIAAYEKIADDRSVDSAWRDLADPIMGAEDFAYVLEIVPGAMFFLGFAPEGEDWAHCCGIHSTRMMLDESVMPQGAALLAGFAARFLERGFD